MAAAMLPNEDGYAKEVIRTVAELSSKFEQYTHDGDEARKELKASVEGTVVQMRIDVHKAITALQLHQSDHGKSHEADRIERTNRQGVVDTQFTQIRNWLIGTLIGIVLIAGVLVGMALLYWWLR